MHEGSMAEFPPPYGDPILDLRRREWLDRAEGDVVVWESSHPGGCPIDPHRHNRCQLLFVRSGVVLVTTASGRWLVPTGHAIWIPAGVEHAVEMLGSVRLQSAYVLPGAVEALPGDFRVMEMTELMRALMEEAVGLPYARYPRGRDGMIFGLVLHEVTRLKELPLGLPFPADARLARLCRAFLDKPSPHVKIDDWAASAGMSRRSFTRLFQRETGVGLSTWRQQACLFAAVPRLAGGEPVTTVALDLGYDSVPAFTTMFRRMLGVSPREWLKDSA